MEWLIENWYLLIALIAVISGVVFVVITFLGLPTGKQLEKVKEWLLWAVSVAESELGGGTGQLKLSMVYDMFIEKFPWLAKLLTFNKFRVLVDEALIKMRNLLETNNAINKVILGEEPEEKLLE